LIAMTRIPLILLPGLLLDERLYDAQIAALAERAEPKVIDLTGADSIAGMAEAALAAAPERFALCGLSMGGYVALEIMRRAPQRVLKLALLDTQARPEGAEARTRRLDLMARAGRGEFEGAVEQLLPLFIHPDRLADRDLVATLSAMARKVGRDGFLRQQVAILNRADSRPSLAAIGCPTLVLAGRQDVLTPVALHEEMAAAIPAATLVALPQCGHLSPLEQPAMVSAQLGAWLAA
jgi:pimeloyl-ACP methyl ester carboxylesterase